MERITNHATDRNSKRTGFQSEYDIDPDLMSKPGAFRVAYKRSYAGNVRQQVGGYQTRRTIKVPQWRMLQMNEAAHNEAVAKAEAAKPKKQHELPKTSNRFTSTKARNAHYRKKKENGWK